jgi:hypothetical protein
MSRTLSPSSDMAWLGLSCMGHGTLELLRRAQASAGTTGSSGNGLDQVCNSERLADTAVDQPVFTVESTNRCLESRDPRFST